MANRADSQLKNPFGTGLKSVFSIVFSSLPSREELLHAPKIKSFRQTSVLALLVRKATILLACSWEMY